MAEEYIKGVANNNTNTSYCGPVQFKDGDIVKEDGSPLASQSIMTYQKSDNQLAQLMGLPQYTDQQAMKIMHKATHLKEPEPIVFPYQLDNADGSAITGDLNKPTVIDNSKLYDKSLAAKLYDETFDTSNPLTGVLKAPDPAKLHAWHKAYYTKTPEPIVFPYQLDNADGSAITGDLNKTTVIDNSKSYDKALAAKLYDETFDTSNPLTGVLKAPDPAKMEAQHKAYYQKTPEPISFPYELDNADGSPAKNLTPYQQSVLTKINQRKAALAQKFAQKITLNSTSNNTTDKTQAAQTSPVLATNTKQSGSEINGKVDKDFCQGQTGDCWLLSTIQAIREKEGGEEYLNSLISVDESTGDVTVNLKGVGKSYTIPKSKIEAQSQFSSGDGDVRALEIAIEKYMRETANTINGKSPSFAMNVLVGNGSNSKRKDDGTIGNLNTNRFNSQKQAFTASFDNGVSDISAINTKTNNLTKLINNHAYAIVKADDDYVYLRNPWDTSELLKIDTATFESLCPTISSAIL